MAIRTAATARAVVRPAISIIRRTRANKAACSGVGSGTTVSVIRLIFGTRLVFFGTRLVFEQRSKAGGHRRRRRGLKPARSRARAARCGAVAFAAEGADPLRAG